jgi:hypothetical protein
MNERMNERINERMNERMNERVQIENTAMKKIYGSIYT